MPDALALIANAAGKVTRLALQTAGRGGTALPGLLALQIDPQYISAVTSSLRHGVVLVSGTNGKTTTARMLSDIVRGAGWSPIHNRSGSNLERGIAGALLADTTWRAEAEGDMGLFEVDEASLPRVLRRVKPRLVIITNLFRDQMDRYFELDQLAKRIGDAVAELDPETTLVLNADDPIVAQLGQEAPCRVVYFGVDDPAVDRATVSHEADKRLCTLCGHRILYERAHYGHLGHYHCPGCGWRMTQIRDPPWRHSRRSATSRTRSSRPRGAPSATSCIPTGS